MKMKDKFDKYWGSIEKINLMLLVAIVLDPRYKIKYVKWCYSRIYPSDKVNDLVRRLMEHITCMFVHYQKIDASSTSTSKAPQIVDDLQIEQFVNEANMQAKSLQSEFWKQMEEEENVMSKTEVDRYLEEGIEKDTKKFEILEWWKSNCARYRILFQIARDVLSVHVSIVASESAFSTGGRILDQFHSSLTPKVVECLICTHDWLRASPIPIELEEKLEELQDLESSKTY